jgi:superfamily II DNA or RNA helicase
LKHQNESWIAPVTKVTSTVTNSRLEQTFQNNLVITNAHKLGPLTRIDFNSLPRTAFDLVIVDEAHHYPAKTWRDIVDHFSSSKRIFLTATPENSGGPILPNVPVCYTLTKGDAENRGLIRRLQFNEVGNLKDDTESVHRSVALAIYETLNSHGPRFQAMVICEDRDSASSFKDQCNAVFDSDSACQTYISGSSSDIVEKFKRGEYRILAIVKILIEGFDNPKVSVVGIIRNIQSQSKILFTQFVGRAVRRSNVLLDDSHVEAAVVSHVRYNQRGNFDQLNSLAVVDPVDEEFM